MSTATISGVLKDSDGTVWKLATWTAVPVPIGSQPVFTPGGAPVLSTSGQLSAAGAFSGTLPRTDSIQPPGTTLTITIHSLTSAPPVVLKGVTIITPTLDLGTLLTPRVPAPRIQAATLVYAYTAGEILNPQNGSGYVNTTDGLLYMYAGGTWTQASGQTFPGAGVAVSTGTAWATSIDPASLITLAHPANGVDLNTLTTTGEYIVSQYANGPAGIDLNVAFLTVLSLGTGSGYLVQLFYPGSQAAPPNFFFVRYETGAVWGPWARVTGV